MRAAVVSARTPQVAKAQTLRVAEVRRTDIRIQAKKFLQEGSLEFFLNRYQPSKDRGQKGVAAEEAADENEVETDDEDEFCWGNRGQC